MAAHKPAHQHPPHPFFPDNTQFWFEAKRVLGSSSYGGSDFGEVVATLQRIKSGDFDSWYTEFHATAERVANEGKQQLARGHRVSARDSYLRAASYHRASEFFLHGNPEDERVSSSFKKADECYKISCGLFEPPILPVEIPYENTTLPGYYHRVDTSGVKRPLVLIHTGFDGSAEELHTDGVRAAVERGFNVLAFDGPGQYGPIHRERLCFRHDWEKVVTPVVDYALTLQDVEPSKIALMGISLGGVLAPRAAAFEKRISALICNDGVYDFMAPVLSKFSDEQQKVFMRDLHKKDESIVDKWLAQWSQTSTQAKWETQQGRYVFGVSTPRQVFAEMSKYHLRDGIAEQISCPTLVMDAENDIFFQGQPQQLFDHLKCPKHMMRFTETEGAGSHCHVGASRLTFARVYDWLEETFNTSR